MNKINQLRLLKIYKFQIVIGVTVIAIGIITSLFVNAALTALALEAEAGSTSGGAQKLSTVAGASNSSYVLFSNQAPSNMNVYLGSTHTHTACCNDHGESETPKSDAKNIFETSKQNGFNFMFLTEHSGGTGPAYQGINPTTFYTDTKAQAVSTSTSSFVGVAGIEYSDNDTDKGHMTAVNINNFMSADGSNNSASLMDYIVSEQAAGRPAYGGFNHPGASGHPGAKLSNLNAARREAIVMSEVQWTTISESKDVNQGLGSFIVHLDRGWRVGPTCNLDGHGRFRLSNWKEPNPCRTGILASSLTRDNLNDAFLKRRIYSTRDVNMQVKYKANDQWMDSKIGKPSTINFDITVNDPDTGNSADKIKKIEIITDGGAVASTQTFDAHSVTWKPSIAANNKKYYFLKIFNGERSYHTAIAAPVWLE